MTPEQVVQRLDTLKDRGVGGKAVAKHLGVQPTTLYQWRNRGCSKSAYLAMECLLWRDVVLKADLAQMEITKLKESGDDT